MAYVNNAFAVRSQGLDPNVRANVLASVGALGQASQCITTTQRSLENANALLNGSALITDPNAMSLDVHRIVRNQYANLFTATANGTIACAENNIINAFADSEIAIANSLNNASASIRKTFKPVNKFIGSTLYNMTGILQDPFGHGLVPGVSFLMDKINPDFTRSHQGAWLAQKMDELSHLPGSIYGSLQYLQSAMTGGQLFGPVQFVKDMYLGAIAIVRSIGKFINDLFQMLQEFVFSILDSIFPLTEILSFLNAVTQIAGTIGAIASAFGGLGQIANFTSQLTSITGQLGSILANPMGLAMRMMPPQVMQGLSYLNNPQALIATLPPPWSTIFCILNTISGTGYTYNMGYALGSTLNNIKSGVLAGIMSAFQCQMQILGNLVTPSVPYTPPTYPNRYRSVSVPGRPGYVLDQHGQIIKSPCTPPTPPYAMNDKKSTANAPSATTEAQAAAQAAAADGSGVSVGPATLNPTNDITAEVIQQANQAANTGQFSMLNQSFTPTTALTDTGKPNFDNLTGVTSTQPAAATPAYTSATIKLNTRSPEVLTRINDV